MRLFQKYFSFFSVIFILGGCSYAVESSNQDVTFMTPGAKDAVCDVYTNGVKYRVHPPQTRNIKKHHEPMILKCSAPGNRYVETEVEPEFSKRSLWGTPAGMAWDFASQSLFYYPSVIAVDFSQEMLKPNEMPQHNNQDIRQPETYDLEEFQPADPRLNSDKDKTEVPLLQRGEEYSDASVEEIQVEEAMAESGDVAEEEGKGDLKSVIDDLTSDNTNDQVTSDESPASDEADSEPMSIYPGQ